MFVLHKSSLFICTILFYCLVWIVDPAYLHLLGYEGIFRWGVAFVALLFALMSSGAPFFATRTFAYQVILVGIGFASAMAVNLTDGYVELMRLAPTCAASALVLAITKAGRKRQLQLGLVVLLGGVAAASIASGYFDGRFFAGRLYGVSWHPNGLTLPAATLCVIALFFPLGNRWSAIASFAIGAWAVLLTDSLTGEVIVVLALAGKAVQQMFGMRLATMFLIGSAALWLAVPVAVVVLVPDYNSWFGQIERSSFVRLIIWNDAVRQFIRHPILGIGFGELVAYNDLYSTGTFYYSHSVVLTYLRTTGLLGFGAITLLLMHTTRKSVQAVSEGDYFPLCLLFPVLMFSSVEAGLQQMPFSWILFWLAAGFALTPAPGSSASSAEQAIPVPVKS